METNRIYLIINSSIIFFILILLLLRIVRIVIENKEYKQLNEYINNWEKNPIIDISTDYSKKGFNENDYFTINSIKLYFKRTKKKYIYPILINKGFTNKKICGKINNISIFFPKYEKCPINLLNLTNNCIPNNNCIKIDTNLFLYYSNTDINNEIYVNISFDKELKYESYIAKNIELDNYYLFKYEKKTNNSILIIEIIFIVLISFNSIIFIFNNEGKILDIFMIISLLLYLLFLLLYGFYSVNLSKFRNNLIKLFEEFNIKKNKIIRNFYNLDKILYCFNYPFLFVFLILFSLFTPFIIVLNNLNYNLPNNGFYKDLLNTINKSPISNIQISSYENDNLQKYEFAKIKTDNEIILFKEWKGNYFFLNRMDNKYNYKSLRKYGKNKKICGMDDFNSNLYFPKNIECPINFIEITQFENCSISNNYKCTSQKLNSKFYFHYSNEYIIGRIIIDLKISSNLLPIGNSETFNELCNYLNYDNCILDNEYFGYEDNIYGYSLIDSNILNNDSSIEIFLYSRNYIHISSNLNKLFLMEKLTTKGFIIYIIISDIIIDILTIIYFFHKNILYFIIIDLISLISFILTIIELINRNKVESELKKENSFDFKDELNKYDYFNSLIILWKKKYYIFYLLKFVIFSCIIIFGLYYQVNFRNDIKDLFKKIKQFIFKKEKENEKEKEIDKIENTEQKEINKEIDIEMDLLRQKLENLNSEYEKYKTIYETKSKEYNSSECTSIDRELEKLEKKEKDLDKSILKNQKNLDKTLEIEEQLNNKKKELMKIQDEAKTKK